jgi:hypothetical protein
MAQNLTKPVDRPDTLVAKMARTTKKESRDVYGVQHYENTQVDESQRN